MSDVPPETDDKHLGCAGHPGSVALLRSGGQGCGRGQLNAIETFLVLKSGHLRGPAPVDPGIRSGDGVGEDQETTA